jgi:hypothetical protein
MSRENLTRTFRTATGRPPAEVFRLIQIRHAKYLLACTDLSTVEIARAAGGLRKQSRLLPSLSNQLNYDAFRFARSVGCPSSSPPSCRYGGGRRPHPAIRHAPERAVPGAICSGCAPRCFIAAGSVSAWDSPPGALHDQAGGFHREGGIVEPLAQDARGRFALCLSKVRW